MFFIQCFWVSCMILARTGSVFNQTGRYKLGSGSVPPNRGLGEHNKVLCISWAYRKGWCDHFEYMYSKVCIQFILSAQAHMYTRKINNEIT